MTFDLKQTAPLIHSFRRHYSQLSILSMENSGSDESHNCVDLFKQMEREIKQYCKGVSALSNSTLSQRLYWSKSNDLSGFKWSDVVDPRNSTIATISSSPVLSVNPGSDVRDSCVNSEAKKVKIVGLPDGLYVLINALSIESQVYWTMKALLEYSAVEHTNKTNLIATKSDNENGKLPKDTIDCKSDWTSTNTQEGYKEFFKLRWSCLGYHYGQLLFAVHSIVLK